MMNTEHSPVLLNEVLALLAPREGDFFVDGTLNGGGHAMEVIAHLGETGVFLGIDLDSRMVDGFPEALGEVVRCPKLFLVNDNFRNIKEIVRSKKLPKPDGLLLDLGFSSKQLQSGIGISFLHDEPLSMTYSRSAKPVSEILEEIETKKLSEVISEYSGERYSEKIALEIKRSLPVTTTRALCEAVERAVPKGYERGRIHKATRTFQALRILANEELINLETVLKDLPEIMASGGRVVIISFHSLEDQRVKQAFKSFVSVGQAEYLAKRPISSSLNERRLNIRSRSAKVRGVKFF